MRCRMHGIGIRRPCSCQPKLTSDNWKETVSVPHLHESEQLRSRETDRPPVTWINLEQHSTRTDLQRTATGGGRHSLARVRTTRSTVWNDGRRSSECRPLYRSCSDGTEKMNGEGWMRNGRIAAEAVEQAARLTGSLQIGLLEDSLMYLVFKLHLNEVAGYLHSLGPRVEECRLPKSPAL